MKLISSQFIKRLFLVCFLLIGLILFIILNGNKYLSLDQIFTIYNKLNHYVNIHFIKSVFIYMIIYILTVFFCIPIKPLMKIIGGLFFGIFIAFFASLFSAAIGALLAFMFVKYNWGDNSFNKNYVFINKFKNLVQTYPIRMLLLARILPIPFFIPNILAGILKVKNSIFFFTTLIGAIPLTFIFVWLGAHIAEAMDTRSINNFIDVRFTLAIASLIIFVLVSLVIRKFYSKSRIT